MELIIEPKYGFESVDTCTADSDVAEEDDVICCVIDCDLCGVDLF